MKAGFTNNQCLSFLVIALSHLPASQLEGWGYNGQNPVSMLITQKLKCLLLLLDVIRLQFIDYKSLLQLVLIVRKYGQGKYEYIICHQKRTTEVVCICQGSQR